MQAVFWICILIVIACVGCNIAGAHVSGSGIILTERIEIGPFDRITLVGAGDLYLEQGSELEVFAEVDENLLQFLTVEVMGDTLMLGLEGGRGTWLSPSQPARFTVGFSHINALQVKGSGQIYSTHPIKAEKLDLYISGAGEMDLPVDVIRLSSSIAGSGELELRGVAKTQRVEIDGSGDYNAFGLASETGYVVINGSGDAEVTVSDELDVRINGSGDVEYMGQPELRKNIHGSGSVKARLGYGTRVAARCAP